MSVDHQLLKGVRRLVDSNLVIGSVGNLSVRDNDCVQITPTRVPYDAIRETDLVTVDLGGRLLAGHRSPSSELELHLAIYRARADVGAVVHAHGPHVVAWSFLGIDLTPHTEEANYYGIDALRVSRFACAGSVDLGTAAVQALQHSPAALLACHGMVSVGSDLEQALVVAEAVEHQAHVACLLRAMDASAAPSWSPNRPSTWPATQARFRSTGMNSGITATTTRPTRRPPTAAPSGD